SCSGNSAPELYDWIYLEKVKINLLRCAIQSPQEHSANAGKEILCSRLRSSQRRAFCMDAAAREIRGFEGCSAMLSFSRSLRCARKSLRRTAIAEILRRAATSYVEYCSTSLSKHTFRRSGGSCRIASAMNARISRRAKRSSGLSSRAATLLPRVSSPVPFGSSSEKSLPSRRLPNTSVEGLAVVRETQACRSSRSSPVAPEQ